MTIYADRLLPHSIEAEEALIGSLLIDGQCFARIAPLLRHDDFYRERNQLCYDAALALYERNASIDQTTLAEELARTGRLETAGGMAYLSHLVASTPTSVHAGDYAAIVARTAAMRRLISAGSRIVELGYGDTEDLENTPAPGRGRTPRRPEHRRPAGLPVLPRHLRPLPAGPAVHPGRPDHRRGHTADVRLPRPG